MVEVEIVVVAAVVEAEIEPYVAVGEPFRKAFEMIDFVVAADVAGALNAFVRLEAKIPLVVG